MRWLTILIVVFTQNALAWPWSTPSPEDQQLEAALLSACPSVLPPFRYDSHGNLRHEGKDVVRMEFNFDTGGQRYTVYTCRFNMRTQSVKATKTSDGVGSQLQVARELQ